MGLNFFARRIQNFCTIPLIANILYKIKYPRIGISPRANLDIQGHFIYGSACGVNEGANLIIPQHATLRLGDDCYIGRYVELGPSGEIKVGNHTSIQDRSILLGDITIGRYCTIAPNVYISSGRHYFDLMPTLLIKDQDQLVSNDSNLIDQHSKPVFVEDDCWLGINVFVMSGVTIGKGAVVGANSVVTKDVAPYVVVAGVPAKPIKKRLDFVPPVSIDFVNPHDWPYFYAGFEVSQLSLEKFSKHGGIATKGAFVICLNAYEGSSIHLMLKNIDSSQSTLIYQGSELEISQDFHEVAFRVEDPNATRFHFTLNSNAENTMLIVKKAWIQ